MKQFLTAMWIIGSLAGAAAAQTVTLALTSPQNGTTVSAGATVEWSIMLEVSSGDNAGLALVATDLVQEQTNPERFPLPYAAGVPAGMSNFSRPAGVSNPGENGNPTGYLGSRRGPAGMENLVQLGGGQNTFGQAPPAATGVAQNVNVVGGVGQSGPVLLAAGSFSAPATEGVYTFRLQNALANVLLSIGAPPNASPATAATLDLSAAEISFTVGGAATICADSNCDGVVTVSDIAFFVTAVTGGEAGWSAAFPGGTAPCDFLGANDVNGDNIVSVSDIAFFVQAITEGGCL